ncbi:MAG: cytochrome [Alphaproteobacteria bacterium]|nr:cytochrome [Alphaproteobacteria bacterium]
MLAAGPLFAKGLIIRRPFVVRLLRRTGTEGKGVRLLARLRRKYGDGPLRLRLPLREQAVILSPRHLRRILAGTPEPFAAASREKQAALAHFQPEGVLVSEGGERAERRRFNEAVLESACPVHSLAPRLAARIEAETAPLRAAEQLGWPAFKRAWFRMVRQAIFGPSARDDERLTDTLEKLRADANWAFLKPRRERLRDRFLASVRERLAEAPPDSLGGLARARATAGSAPEHQIAHWLFAFDAAAIAGFRTLAMLALHPQAAARARESDEFRRACLLETLRLWPTTPAVLRETRAETQWEASALPAGTGLLIHLPFFHRDGSRIPYADRFVPDIWLDGRAEAWPFVPFSTGPAGCPARNLVLFLASAWIAALIRGRMPALPAGAGLDPAGLPATFDHFALRLKLAPLETSRAAGEEPARPASVDPSFQRSKTWLTNSRS